MTPNGLAERADGLVAAAILVLALGLSLVELSSPNRAGRKTVCSDDRLSER